MPAFSAGQVTRLGNEAIPRMPYGSFAGKTEQVLGDAAPVVGYVVTGAQPAYMVDGSRPNYKVGQ